MCLNSFVSGIWAESDRAVCSPDYWRDHLDPVKDLHVVLTVLRGRYSVSFTHGERWFATYRLML